MKKLKQFVAVGIILSMLVGSIGVLKSTDSIEEGRLIGFGTYSTTNHEPDPSKS